LEGIETTRSGIERSVFAVGDRGFRYGRAEAVGRFRPRCRVRHAVEAEVIDRVRWDERV
jgi:hypothetical protein